MRVTVEKRSRWIPKWNGNRELPEAEQVVAWWDTPNWELRRRFVRHSDAKVVLHGDVTKKSDAELDREIDRALQTTEITVTTDTRGLAAAVNISFEHLEDQNGTALDTWKKVCEAPDSPGCRFSELITEVQAAVLNQAEEPDRKNS